MHNGVAKNASIWDIRALDCNKSALLSDAITSLDWIVQNHGKPAVAVLSLGGAANALMDAAVESMFNAGILVVAAGGNSQEGGMSCIVVCAQNPCSFSHPRNTRTMYMRSNDAMRPVYDLVRQSQCY